MFAAPRVVQQPCAEKVVIPEGILQGRWRSPIYPAVGVQEGIAECRFGDDNLATGERGCFGCLSTPPGGDVPGRPACHIAGVVRRRRTDDDRKRLEIAPRTPESTGEIRLGFAGVGNGRVIVGGELPHEQNVVAQGTDLGAHSCCRRPARCRAPARRADRLTFEYDLVSYDALPGILGLTVGIEPDVSDPDGLIAEAVEAARAADVAVVVVGTNSKVESEGYDRTSLQLPGRQDDLVRAVAAANSRTVVVVNSGSPVLMPWRNDVAAVLLELVRRAGVRGCPRRHPARGR